MAKIVLDRPPQTDEELYYLVQALWGVTIPRHKVCPDHDAPFDAFADAYFERNGSISLWHGSRGLSGKSFMVSILGITKAFVKGADVNLLGGSLAQSTNIHEHMRNAFGHKNAPTYMIESEGNYLIKLNNRARIRPLTASQKTVRGPHPPFLICVAEGTRVATPDGEIEIQNIRVGQTVLGSTNMADKTATVVTKVTRSGYRRTVVVETDGQRITCTPDHRIWTQRGWVEAQHLTTEDMLSVREGHSWEGQQEDWQVPRLLEDGAEQQEGRVPLPGLRRGSSDIQGEALQAVLRPEQESHSESLPGLLCRTQAERHQALSPVPPEAHEQRTCCRQIRGGEGDRERRRSSVESGRAGRGTDSTLGAGVQHQHPVREVDSGFHRGQDSDRSSRDVLARSAEECCAGSEEEGASGAGRVHRAVLEDGSDTPLVARPVRSVRSGPYVMTWDITTTTGNFLAENVLVHNCDEIDEMDENILNAALGQPMPQKNYAGEIIKPYTVMVSTWQNSDGTFEHKYREFQEKGLPIRTWCVAQDSLVTTSRGEILIQEVTDSDFVLTRNGFRKVQHVTFMGYKPTIGLNVGDKTLWATDDHLVAVDNGWRHVGALAADSMSPVRPNPSVLGCELMPLAAMSSAGLIPPGSGFVHGVGNQVKVLDVDASSVATQVIDRVIRGDGTENVLPDPAMGLDDSILSLNSLGSVAVALTSRPVNAVSGEHGNIILPVWDIGVEGDDHEFVANGVLVHNCYKDTANPIDGWLSEETIEQKKREIPKEMWRVEYELGEPSIGNRAFDTDKVEETFNLPLEPIESEVKDRYEKYMFEKPVGDGVYVVAADWAKEQDYTVISIMRVDRQPHTLVWYMRVNRRPYPMMINWFNEAIDMYNAEAIHDATGLGNVVNDYIDVRARKFIMTGEKRSNMLTEYVGAVERNYFSLPRIPSLYSAHKYCRTGDLYSNTQDYHLPDEVCSMALAWHLAKRHSGYGEAITVPKDSRPGRYEKHFQSDRLDNDSIVSPRTEGTVVNKTADLEDGINLLV